LSRRSKVPPETALQEIAARAALSATTFPEPDFWNASQKCLPISKCAMIQELSQLGLARMF
jgi:hypothetical protein